MKLFHKHNWEEVARTYAPPHNLPAMSGYGAIDLLERAVSGMTTILWKCRECEKFRKDEMLGKITTNLLK